MFSLVFGLNPIYQSRTIIPLGLSTIECLKGFFFFLFFLLFLFVKKKKLKSLDYCTREECYIIHKCVVDELWTIIQALLWILDHLSVTIISSLGIMHLEGKKKKKLQPHLQCFRKVGSYQDQENPRWYACLVAWRLFKIFMRVLAINYLIFLLPIFYICPSD